MEILQKKILVVAASALMLCACGSDDDDAVADAGANFNLKERRTVVVSGAKASGEGDVTVNWSQVSGPALVLSGSDTLTPTVTAPSVDADAQAVLRLTVTDSKGQTATDEVTVALINNTPPQISATFTPIAEKSAATLTATITDDDEVAAISWLQTAGPSVTLTGADSAEISFTAPAVTVATTLTFTITATDDDNDTSQVETSVTVEPNLLAFALDGTVSGASFNGGAVVISGAAAPVTVLVDENGSFSAELNLDDDLLDTVVSVQVTSATNSALRYSAIYSGFADAEPVVVSTARSKSAADKVKAQADGSNVVSVNAVSTALYALLVSANNGAVPANIEQLVFTEKSVDAQALVEAAAIIKIFTDNPALALPEGVTDLTGLLVNVAAYNQVVEQINADNPELIAQTITAIAEDPVLTPPLATGAVPSLYFQTPRAATGFVTRSGERWQFDSDGKGSRTTTTGSYVYNWTLNNGKIDVAYTNPVISVSFEMPVVGLAGLSQQQVNALLADNYNQVEVRRSASGSVLTRTTQGQALDTYRIVSQSAESIQPLNTSEGLITAPGTVRESIGNIMMRKVVSASASTFTAETMPGVWAMNSYFSKMFANGTGTDFYLDPLQFNADGSGVGLDTERTFDWSIANGQLTLNFADGTRLVKQILDQSGTDFSVFTIAYNAAGALIGSRADYGFKVDETASFATTAFVNPTGKYWQTTINQWTFNSWVDGRLVFCSGNDTNEQGGCNFGSNYFGWQFDSNATGWQASSYLDLPPAFERAYANNEALNWELKDDATLSFNYAVCNFDAQQSCRVREWQLLKVEQGVLGTRIYVIEEDFIRFDQQSDFGLWIGTRMNIYEQLDFDYWNNSLATVSAAAVKTKVAERKILYPGRQPDTVK